MSNKITRPRRRSTRPTPSRRAPLLLAAVGVVLLGAVALLAWRGSPPAANTGGAAGSPSLKADRTRVDLGDVRLGETVSVAFKLTNTGTGPLRFAEKPWVEVVEGC